MKTLVSLVLLVSAATAWAGPSKSKTFALCKAEAKAVLGSETRVKLKRFAGSKAHLRVSAPGVDSMTVICRADAQAGVQLARRDGGPVRFLSKSH